MKKTRYSILDNLKPKARELYDDMAVEVRASLRVADLLHQAMTEDGLNQKQLAGKLKVTPGYVSRLLAGDENPSVGQMARMLSALGRSYMQNVGQRVGNFDVIIGQKTSQKNEFEITHGSGESWINSSLVNQFHPHIELHKGA